MTAGPGLCCGPSSIEPGLDHDISLHNPSLAITSFPFANFEGNKQLEINLVDGFK